MRDNYFELKATLCEKNTVEKYTYDTQNTDKNLKVNMLVQKTVGPSTKFGDQILFFLICFL